MLSGTRPAPGARNAHFMLVPASPGSLLHRPPLFPGESAGFTRSPWGDRALAREWRGSGAGVARDGLTGPTYMVFLFSYFFRF